MNENELDRIGKNKNPVTYEEVADAAFTLFERGESVTQQKVHALVGRGSTTTINKHLRRWRAESAAPADTSDSAEPSPFLLHAVKELEARARQMAADEIASIEEAAQTEIEAMRERMEQAKEAETTARARAAEAALDAEKQKEAAEQAAKKAQAAQEQAEAAEARAAEAEKLAAAITDKLADLPEQARQRIAASLETGIASIREEMTQTNQRAIEEAARAAATETEKRLERLTTAQGDALLRGVDAALKSRLQALEASISTSISKLETGIASFIRPVNERLDKIETVHKDLAQSLESTFSEMRNSLNALANDLQQLQSRQDAATSDLLARIAETWQALNEQAKLLEAQSKAGTKKKK